MSRKIRVLVVDDHMLVREGIRAVLDGVPDIEVVGEAGSGEESLSAAEICQPDVILMDLDMPGSGGIAATRALTSAPIHPAIHPAVVILTMYSEDERLVEALHAGARGYLTKNLVANELITAVRTAADGDVYVRPQAGPIIAASLRPTPPEPIDHHQTSFDRLSDRERSVLCLVARGHTSPEIGRSLGITSKTVDTYRRRIQEKIGLARRTDYIRLALTLNLLTK